MHCDTYRGSFRGGTRGNAVPIVKVFKNAKKMHQIAYAIANFLFRGDTPARAPNGAWTQTPISARLAKVHTFLTKNA